MPISSLIVRASEPAAHRIADALAAITAVTSCEVRGPDLVVVTRTGATSEDEALWQHIEQIEGVRAVELVYHNFEDLVEE